MIEYYQKVNGAFVPVGYEFTGFPSNGLWLVENGKQNCLIPMGDKPEFPDLVKMEYLMLREELTQHLTTNWEEKALSTVDIATIACNFFAEKAKLSKNT